MKVAVVGHVEWVQLAKVEALPAAGEIVEAPEGWELAAGGGAVAAVQLAKLAGGCVFYTALGEDERGRASKRELEQLGVEVDAAWRPQPQRQAFVFLDSSGERTITTIGPRLEPCASDPLAWERLSEMDGVYVTAGDAGAVHAAREAATLTSTPRAMRALAEAHEQLDALICSDADDGERYEEGDLHPAPRLVARTEGASGGTIEWADGRASRWKPAAPPGPRVDAYGAGDSFAAGLTYGLAAGLSPEDAAALGARCGAACISGRGPYEGQIRSVAR